MVKKVIHLSKKHYFPKMKGGHPLPPRPGLRYIFVSWFTSMAAISVLYGISFCTDSLLIMAPFGATCVLIFGAPDSPLAQPRNVIGGHLIATVISLIFLNMFGNQWWVVAMAVATAIAVMQQTRTLHPPAGANPIVILLTQAPWHFIISPVLAGAIILVFCGVIKNNLSKERAYPKYWW